MDESAHRGWSRYRARTGTPCPLQGENCHVDEDRSQRAGVAALALTASHRRRAHADPRSRLDHRVSVRQGGRRAVCPQQSEVPAASHRGHGHRRWHEAVLRRRRRAVPRHRERVAPDQGERAERTAPPTASPRSPKFRSASTASSFATSNKSSQTYAPDDDRHLQGNRGDAVRQAEHRQDVEGRRSRSCRTSPILVYGPSSISGTRDALGELIMTAGLQVERDDRRDGEDRRRQVQVDLHQGP